MVHCIVVNCEGKVSSDSRYFGFPKNSQLLRKWCENLKITPDALNTSTKVCHRHFDASLLGKRGLKKGSIPTLQLGRNDENIHLPELNVAERVCYCCVPMCPSTSLSHSLHLMPAEPEKRASWMKACGIEHEAHKKRHYICNRHFDKHYATNKKIQPDAFPKHFLPPQYPTFEQVTFNEEEGEEEEEEVVVEDVVEEVVEEVVKEVVVEEEKMDPNKTATCTNCEKFCKNANFHRQKLLDVQREFKQYVSYTQKQVADLQEQIKSLKERIAQIEGNNSQQLVK